jgi:c-di-GMP-binding flagellar brake protein YcgR
MKSKEALRIIHTTVVGTGAVGINTIKLKVNEVETIQRRGAPRAKAIVPVSIRKTGSRDWARTKSVDINTNGLRINASGSSDMESGQMLDVAITRLGSVPIVFCAKVVECKNEYGQAAKTHMMRLSIDNIDTQNWQALYRLVQPRLEQTTYKSWSV